MSKRAAEERDLRDSNEWKSRSRSVAENKMAATEPVVFQTTYIVKILDTPEFKLAPTPPGEPDHPGWGVSPGTCLMIGSPCKEDAWTVTQVIIGRMVKRSQKVQRWSFVPDPDKEIVIMKAMLYKDKSGKAINPILYEYDTNSSLIAKNPLAGHDAVNPTFCYAPAGYQTVKGATNGEAWIDADTLKIILQPRHIPFATVLDDPSYTDNERRELWKSGWVKLRIIHEDLKSAHRDVKVDNAVVKSKVVEEEGKKKLMPVRPLELLWVDATEAADVDKYTPNIIAGTTVFTSVSVLNAWMLHWFTTQSLTNPLIIAQAVPNPPKPAEAAKPQAKTKKGKEKMVKSVEKEGEEKEGKEREGDEMAGKEKEGEEGDMDAGVASESGAAPVVKPLWAYDEVALFRALLLHQTSNGPQAENDTWSWGLNLLDYLDHSYILAIAVKNTFWEGYKKALPAQGVPETYSIARKRVADLCFAYSPISNTKTYRLKLDVAGKQISQGKVEVEWWPLLEDLLTPPQLEIQTGWVKDQQEFANSIGANFDLLSAQPENLTGSTSTTTSAVAKLQHLDIAESEGSARGVGAAAEGSGSGAVGVMEPDEARVVTGTGGGPDDGAETTGGVVATPVVSVNEPAQRPQHHRTLEGVFKDDLLTFRDIVPDLPDAPGPVHRKRSYLCPFVGICTRSLDKSPAKYNTIDLLKTHYTPGSGTYCKKFNEAVSHGEISVEVYDRDDVRVQYWTIPAKSTQP